jgi:DNA repair exonuclease SbcCD nuclease subunit
MSTDARFACLGDPHLRRCIWGQRSTIVGDTYVAFNCFIDYCVEQKINGVLCGDVFHSKKPDSEAVLMLKLGASRMQQANLTLFGLDGNHDLIAAGGDYAEHLKSLGELVPLDPSWLDVAGGVSYINDRMFEPAPGICAYGMNFRQPQELERDLGMIAEQVRVLICHQTMDWAMPLRWNMKAEWVPRYVLLTLGGDYHVPCEHQIEQQHFIQIGSPARMALDENHPKSFLVVTQTSDPLSYSWQRVALPYRPMIRLALDSNSQMDEFVARAPAELSADHFAHLPGPIRKPILHVTYHSSINQADTRITTVVGELAHLWLESYSMDLSSIVLPTDLQANEDFSEAAVMATLINPSTEREAYELALQLVQAPNPNLVIDQIRKRYDVGTQLGVESA